MELLERAMRECGYNNAIIRQCLNGSRLYIFGPVDWGYIEALKFEGADYDIVTLDGVEYMLSIEN